MEGSDVGMVRAEVLQVARVAKQATTGNLKSHNAYKSQLQKQGRR